MKIPIILSDQSIKSGSTGPQAGAGDFMIEDNVGQGLQNLARGARSVASAKYAIEQQQKQHDDVRWVNESFDQERKYLHDWAIVELDKGDENVGENFWKHANERISQYEAKAPSARAATAYKNQINDFIFGRYVNLTKAGQDIRIDKTTLDINDQISNSLGIYRETRGMPGSSALIELNKDYERIGKYIGDVFDKMAPSVSHKLREQLAVDMALGTMDHNPAFAKMIIESDKYLDERTRSQLKHQLDRSLNETNELAKDAFKTVREDHKVAVEAGATNQKIPLTQYESVLGKTDAIIEKRKDDFVIDVHNRVNQFMDKFAGKNVSKLSSEFNALRRDMRTAEDKATLQLLEGKVHDVVQLQQKNRVAWLTQYNPNIQRLTKEAEEAPTQALKTQALRLRNAAIREYQGRAPKNAKDPDMYMGLSTDDVSLLEVGAATNAATAINKGTASEVIDQINGIFSQFPDDEDKFIALRDLVNLPASGKGLRWDYQMVWTHRDKFWVDSLIGAIDKSGELGKLNPVTRSKIEELVDKNETWVKFRRTHVVDNSQRSDEVNGYREAVLAFSNALMLNGESEKSAVNKAVNLLIRSELGFTSANGQPLAITKRRADGVDRTDEEIANFGPRLELALEFLNPADVNAANFPMLKKFQMDENKWNYFYQQLRDKSFFQLSPDGQSVSIYFPDDVGLPFQLTDKAGNEFRIMLDELPAFSGRSISPLTGRQYYDFNKSFSPHRSEKIYEEQGDFLGLGDLFGTKRMTTNWPVTPDWIKRQPKGGKK